MLIITLGIVGLVISFYYFNPFFKDRTLRKIIIKVFFILMLLSIVAYGIIMYYIYYDKPESFRRGVELLENNNQIRNLIGSYESYSYLIGFAGE